VLRGPPIPAPAQTPTALPPPSAGTNGRHIVTLRGSVHLLLLHRRHLLLLLLLPLEVDKERLGRGVREGIRRRVSIGGTRGGRGEPVRRRWGRVERALGLEQLLLAVHVGGVPGNDFFSVHDGWELLLLLDEVGPGELGVGLVYRVHGWVLE